jgi:hypothetical protein
MISVDSLLEAASNLLTARVGSRVRLADAGSLQSDNVVVRARVSTSARSLPPTVIVKHVTDEGFDQPGHAGPPSRFLNEWATLQFLTDLDAEVAPRLIAADREIGLTIIEDLGALPNLENILVGDDEGAAWDGLGTAGRLLGELHAIGREREGDFVSLQSRLGTRSPMSDSTIDQRGRRDECFAAFEAMGVDPGARLWNEVIELESLIHDDSPFRSLIHADAGPHNVLISSGVSRLIDFEFAVFGNALCDVVGARLGFPQTMGVGQVPTVARARLEDAYREAVVPGIPNGEDEALFRRHLAAACGHWALNRWTHGWRAHLSSIPDGERPTEAAVTAMKSLWLVIDGFVAASRDYGAFQLVADALGRSRETATKRWPELVPAPVYPALWNL